MVNVRNIEVFKMSFFLGLFGVFAGIVLAIIQMVLWGLGLPLMGMYGAFGNLILPFFGFWMSVILYPIMYGICFFICGLIFTPLVNLTLKILGGIEFSIWSNPQDKLVKLDKKFRK